MTGVLNESHGAAGCKVAIGSLFIECNHLGGVATTIDFFERSELCYDADVLSQRNGTMGGMLAVLEQQEVQVSPLLVATSGSQKSAQLLSVYFRQKDRCAIAREVAKRWFASCTC